MKGKTIRKIREQLGLTQVELGELLGAHAVTVSRWEVLDHSPSDFQVEILKVFRKAAKEDTDVGSKAKLLLREDNRVGALALLLAPALL